MEDADAAHRKGHVDHGAARGDHGGIAGGGHRDIARAKMVERTGGPKSVPQIFIDNKHVGGCDDIHALDDQGKLDTLLAA